MVFIHTSQGMHASFLWNLNLTFSLSKLLPFCIFIYYHYRHQHQNRRYITMFLNFFFMCVFFFFEVYAILNLLVLGYPLEPRIFLSHIYKHLDTKTLALTWVLFIYLLMFRWLFMQGARRLLEHCGF